jgi:hypothetical protein
MNSLPLIFNNLFVHILIVPPALRFTSMRRVVASSFQTMYIVFSLMEKSSVATRFGTVVWENKKSSTITVKIHENTQNNYATLTHNKLKF